MPNEQPRNPFRKIGEWMADHRRILYAIFLALAALNGWASYTMFRSHPWFAVPNAMMAALLAIFVVSTWGTK